ncbi:MAG: histidine phosphatase family protein [Eubacteriaceae bacterium]
MKLILVRHVETYGNIEHRLNGHTESDYTPRGEMMKEILIDELIALNDIHQFDTIFSSPISRAAKIAFGVGEKLNQSIKTDERLKEFNFGIFEGKTREECIAENEEAWNTWLKDYADHVIPKGQSQSEYHQLCKSFIEELPSDKVILVVAHGGTIHGILMNLLEIPMESKWHFEIKLGSITIVDVIDGFGVLTEMMTPKYDEGIKAIELKKSNLNGGFF